MNPPSSAPTVAVIGGGPAGLRAAEVAADAGAAVTLFDARPSVGRKFLVAGRGGLNLTKSEPLEAFRAAYRGPDLPPADWAAWLSAFPPEALREWAHALGVETFVASTGRVYPRAMKAAPLLRRWIERLRAHGVRFCPRHRWIGFAPDGPVTLRFATPDGPILHAAGAAVLALGGGSWPETGSDGAWVETVRASGVAVSALAPANCGWETPWTPELLAQAEGRPIKNVMVTAGRVAARGELLLTRYGLEGGALYQLGAELRAMEHPAIVVDFKPDVARADLVRRLGTIRRNFAAEAAARWKLGPAAGALLAANNPGSAEETARLAKAFPVALTGPRPLAEAISSAGGVCWPELDSHLMVRSRPGVFCAGEMIDWEAPTGGYLMQGCFVTGTRAGRSAARWAAG